MPAPTRLPSNVAEELFPDTFGGEALDLVPLDATATAKAFEPYALTVALRARAPYAAAGLIPPLELIIAAPSGRHERRELTEVPLAVVITPTEGGMHRVTLREVAHNRWWGGTSIDVDGGPAT